MRSMLHTHLRRVALLTLVAATTGLGGCAWLYSACDERLGVQLPFLTGFLNGTQYWGRPVDVLVLGDGSTLVSDDLNGVIYRVFKAT